MKTCLFINSNPSDRAIFVTALFDTSPETICSVADGDKEALDIMSHDSITPDCIFVELSMPGIDGFQFLKRIKRVHALRKTPVIVHCPSPDPFCVAALKDRGAFAIYSLPYNYRGMCNVLSIYLTGEAKLSLN